MEASAHGLSYLGGVQAEHLSAEVSVGDTVGYSFSVALETGRPGPLMLFSAI